MELKPIQSISFFPHQEEGIRWMIERETIGTLCGDAVIRGGLQCDDMGLGKTIQIIGTILNNPRESTLIICPLATIGQWERVALMVSSDFNIFRTQKCGKIMIWREIGVVDPGKRGIYLANFESIQRNPYLVRKRWWDRIVVDEAHRLCGRGAMFQLLGKVRSTIRWAVTGTPIVNRERDIWALLEFLGVARSQRKLVLPREFMIRRGMDELRETGMKNLPEKPDISYVSLTPSQRESEIYSTVKTQEYTPKILRFLRLRQASAHPKILVNEFPIESTKVKSVCDEVCIGRQEHKYIVFCQFIKEMQILSEAFRLRGMCAESIEMYNGTLNAVQRTETLERAKKDTCRVLLMQIQCGGVGLNLQEFNTCIFVSPYWTSALVDQSVARAVRIGQKQVVRVIFLIHGSSTNDEDEEKDIDQYVLSVADSKRKMLNELFCGE